MNVIRLTFFVSFMSLSYASVVIHTGYDYEKGLMRIISRSFMKFLLCFREVWLD